MPALREAAVAPDRVRVGPQPEDAHEVRVRADEWQPGQPHVAHAHADVERRDRRVELGHEERARRVGHEARAARALAQRARERRARDALERALREAEAAEQRRVRRATVGHDRVRERGIL